MNDTFSELNKILSSFSKGKKEFAYSKMKKFSKNHPTNQKIIFNLAVMEQDLGLTDVAITNYLYLINKFDYYNAKKNLYLLYVKEKKYLKALEIVEGILDKNPKKIDVLLDKAYILFKSEKIESALKICKEILSFDDNNIKAINILGQCHIENENFKDAIEILLKGISHDHKNIALLNSLGKLYFFLWDLQKSEYYYLEALNHNPDSYQTLNNLAGFYLETNNSKKALMYYQKAIAILPNEPTILNNMSKAYLSLNDLDRAEQYCLKSLKIRDEDSFKKIISIIYFKKHDFKKAWNYFDGRLGLNDFVERNKTYNLIKNKLLRNRKIDKNKDLLVLREQGVGDEILYGTIYKDLLKENCKVKIEADKRLIPLFLKSFGSEYSKNFFELGFFSNSISKLNNFNQILYAGSLGFYFRTKIEDFPKDAYMKINDRDISNAIQKLKICNKKFKVGLSWKSFKNTYALQKSINLKELKFLERFDNIDFINLQYGDVEDEILEFNNLSKTKIIEINDVDLTNDLIQVASILKNIDLFITVSNSTAHLAGSLGVKTLLIKPFNQATFHYWNQTTNKTPWYESIELLEREDVLNTGTIISKISSILG